MLAAVGKGNRIVTLDIPGHPWETPQLAQQLERWKLDGRDVSLLIGGPEGLALPSMPNGIRPAKRDSCSTCSAIEVT